MVSFNLFMQVRASTVKQSCLIANEYLTIYHFVLLDEIQGDSGGKVNILGGEKKNLM
jgi:hypothetical protein